MNRIFLSLICGLVSLVLLPGCGSSGGTGAAPASSAVTPTAPPSPPTGTPSGTAGTTEVLTYHNDNQRTAQNLTETTLTTSNVNSKSFGRLNLLGTDGPVDAEPLIAANVTIGGTTRNVLYVATENDSVYAYDADSGTLLKQVSLAGSGETPSGTHSCDQVTPEIGITATPVIDRKAGANGTIFLVAMSVSSSGTYYQRLHALDLTTLAEQSGSPAVVQASFPGSGPNSSGGTLTFSAGQYEERAGLLLSNGIIYTTWTSHCDADPYNGWVISYNESSLAQEGVLNLTPNGARGAIWQAGGAPAADTTGNVYLIVANGSFDTTLDANGMPAQGDYGNAFVKISAAATPTVLDYFTMTDTVSDSAADIDFGSGAALLLPDLVDASGTTRSLAVGAGKDGNLYVVDRNSMGKFNSNANANYQIVANAVPGRVFSAPAYFGNTVYYADVGGTLKAFSITNALLSSAPSSSSTATFPYPGASPAISANGSSNAIVWALESSTSSVAVLHAYNATNLATELYNSGQASGNRDQFGNGNKFVTPAIANGKVYVGTASGVAVFGLLP